MIYKQCVLTIANNTAKLDEDIYLYRLDKNVELYFTIVNNKYKFDKSDLNNIINVTNASYFQMRLYKNAEVKYTFAIQPTDNGQAILTITNDLIDEPIEVGDYDFQISLLDADKSSMISMPIASKQLHVCEPLVTDASETGTAILGLSTLETTGEIVDAFDENGNYIRQIHVNGELISAELFNKWETALETNSTNISTLSTQFRDIANNFTTEQTDSSFIIKYGNKIIAEIPLNTSSSEENFGNLLSSITTWNVMGNSITDEGINPRTKYPTILKNKYTNITTVNNYAHNGWHVAVKSGTGYNSFLTLIDSMSSSCDLITVAGGVNDFIQGVPIGERSSTLDTEFYGAVNNLITRLRTKYPNATIIWIIPIPMRNGVFGTNSDGTNKIGNILEDYRKALRNKLNDLNVKCIDLSTDADMDYNKITTDGVHPTANGHQVFANKLESSIPFVPPEEQIIPCTNITLNQSTLTFTTTDSQTLIATKTPSNTTNSVVWSVNPADIVTVNNGVITPIKNGNCTITATCGNKTATCSVTVNIDTSIIGDEKLKLTMTGYQYSGFDLTALVNNPKTAISKIKFKLKAHNFTDCAVSESPSMVAVFRDTTGELNNGEGTTSSVYAKYSKEGDYYVYSFDINNTYTENYLKVPIFMSISSKDKECSIIVDDIQILIDDVKVPILKLGGYFSAESLTGDIDYIINYVNNLS